MSAPILNPAFAWIGSATHSDVSAFAERQKARMKAAEQARKSASPANVKQMPTKKRG